MRNKGGNVEDVRKNLFEALSPQAADDFGQGAGNELRGKMCALHSSSALAVNVFHYLQRTGNLNLAARALGIRQGAYDALRFEAQFPVRGVKLKFPNAVPHLDAILTGSSKPQAVAIEGKFREPYGRKHRQLRQTYLDLANDIWEGWDALRNAAEELIAENWQPEYLDAAQLITHLLGLRSKFGPTGFRLIILWYDVPFDEGAAHRKEIEEFRDLATEDQIRVEQITYQDVIADLATERVNHPDYVDWLAERYL